MNNFAKQMISNEACVLFHGFVFGFVWFTYKIEPVKSGASMCVRVRVCVCFASAWWNVRVTSVWLLAALISVHSLFPGRGLIHAAMRLPRRRRQTKQAAALLLLIKWFICLPASRLQVFLRYSEGAGMFQAVYVRVCVCSDAPLTGKQTRVYACFVD